MDLVERNTTETPSWCFYTRDDDSMNIACDTNTPRSEIVDNNDANCGRCDIEPSMSNREEHWTCSSPQVCEHLKPVILLRNPTYTHRLTRIHHILDPFTANWISFTGHNQNLSPNHTRCATPRPPQLCPFEFASHQAMAPFRLPHAINPWVHTLSSFMLTSTTSLSSSSNSITPL